MKAWTNDAGQRVKLRGRARRLVLERVQAALRNAEKAATRMDRPTPEEAR